MRSALLPLLVLSAVSVTHCYYDNPSMAIHPAYITINSTDELGGDKIEKILAGA